MRVLAHQRERRPEATVVTRGRAARTPFVALGAVAIAAWLVVGLITAAALLVWLLM